MQRRATILILAICALCAAFSTVQSADKLEGDARDEARDRLKVIKKSWDEATKAEKFAHLRQLSTLPERKIGNFLEDVMTDDDEDHDVAGRAAWALAMHGDLDDADELEKAFKRAKTAERRAAVIRWLGLFGAEKMKEISSAALDDDASAEPAVLALTDVGTDEAWDAIEVIAQAGKSAAAKKTAIGLLLEKGDPRGVEVLGNARGLEDAAAAAHFAVGTDLETDALKVVLNFARRSGAVSNGKRPHFFGSLLARLTKIESHQAVLSAVGELNRSLDTETGWWLISVNRAPIGAGGVKGWLKDNDKDDILKGLRYIQRLPKPYRGDDLKFANERLAALLDHKDDDIVAHTMFSCVSTGACEDKLGQKIAVWIKNDSPDRRAAALLAAGQSGAKKHADRAVELLKDQSWYVRSAALDCLLRLRPEGGAVHVLELAKTEAAGRIFAECLALLVDLTGEDFGDELKDWKDWLAGNEAYKTQARKLDTLRGVPYRRLKSRTGATFYGMEINSANVQFALDRSVSMVNAVRREPERRGFKSRKEDILKRRPEVRRMVRDGFLPRFYVAAAELGAALDGMNQNARFGITLFNHEQMNHDRVQNGIKERREAVNWMLSTDIQGGTDIRKALLEIINSGEPDTIVLLSDGEPMGLSILEMIARENVVKRVDIMVVSIHKELYHRHYLNALATRHYGKIVDAEPTD